MEYTFKDLKKKTAAQLREIAEGIEGDAVQGYTQMNKDHLVEAICHALDIEMHEHHEVVGLDKTKIKAKIHHLKKKRDTAIQEKKKEDVVKFRHEIKELKNALRRATI